MVLDGDFMTLNILELGIFFLTLISSLSLIHCHENIEQYVVFNPSCVIAEIYHT